MRKYLMKWKIIAIYGWLKQLQSIVTEELFRAPTKGKNIKHRIVCNINKSRIAQTYHRKQQFDTRNNRYRSLKSLPKKKKTPKTIVNVIARNSTNINSTNINNTMILSIFHYKSEKFFFVLAYLMEREAPKT